MRTDEDMSNTFVSDVGQKSAIFKEDEIEELDKEESKFPEVEIEPPKEMPSTLEPEKEEEKKEEPSLEKEDEEFLEAKKKKKSKKYKKRNPFCMFLLIIVCLALGAGASYYYFEVDHADHTTKTNTKKTKNNKKTSEELSPESVFVKQLVERYQDIDSYPTKNYEFLYAKDKTLGKEFDINLVHRLAITNLRNDFYFSKEALQESMDQLFGEGTYTVKEETISMYKQCAEYEYQDGYYTLKQGTECGGTSVYDMYHKIVKAEKQKDTITINVAVALTDRNKLYKAYDVNTNAATDEIEEIVYSGFDMEKDYDKFNQYQYTLKYNSKTDNYYLESITLVEK